MDCLICFVKLLLASKMKWLEKLRALNPWSLIGLLIFRLAIISSIAKGQSSERVFIGI